MSQPGAFAQASQQCTCREDQMRQQLQPSNVYLPSQQRIVRPAPMVPTDCQLDSIRTLRRRVQKRADPALQQKLRQAYFVGIVSEHRSLIQWQEELCLLHHARLAQALFYQLALARFGGNRVATLGRPIHVQSLIEQVLQMEEDLQDEKVGLVEKRHDNGKDKVGASSHGLSQVNETNTLLAKQATSCLWDNSAMLEEYFGIRLEQEHDKNANSQSPSPGTVLTGLPILLEGHAPAPHGLPLFLLRLATEVNWEEERPCFDGICRELGYFYAELPSLAAGKQDQEQVDIDASCKAYIQHTLFPALSFLLVPSERMHADAKTLTVLSNLYKVFERC